MSAYRSAINEGIVKAGFAADLVNVDRFCAEALNILNQRNLQRYEFAVQILLREGLNNAVIHGCKSDNSKLVEALFSVEEKRLRIEISDQGAGFPWRDMLARTTDDRETSGRGFEIFQKYSTSYCYNDRGNHLTIMLSLAS